MSGDLSLVLGSRSAEVAIRRRMQHLGLTEGDLALRTRWTIERARDVLSGHARLTADCAVQIEEAIGLSAVEIMHADAERQVWEARVRRGARR